MLARQVDLSEVQVKVVDWVQKKMPQAQSISIANFERSGSGFSNESFLFDLSWYEADENRSEGMVLRSAPQAYPIFPDYDIGMQFRIMECLCETNVPVPKMYWFEEDESVLGKPFYLMRKLNGVVPSETPPYHTFGLYYDATPEQRTKMWWGSLEAMTNVHKLDWQRLGIASTGVPGDNSGSLDWQIDYYEKYLNWAKVDPNESESTLESTLDWLKKNRYTPEWISLCWGDAKLGNTMYGPDLEVIGVFDWEMAFIGDPELDLAHFILLDWVLSEGAGTPRLEGSPNREETIQRYQELTGWKVRNLFYNDVLAAFKFGVIMFKCYKNFKEIGILPASSDVEHNNSTTHRLARLLNLPAPGPEPVQRRRIEEIQATVQLHFTGPGGSDWYIVADKGKVERHKGITGNPDTMVTILAEDWDAIQSGKMARIHAFTGGKIKVEGDETLWRQLENIIHKLWSD